MSAPIQELDTLPWYRQFWPWFVFSLPASVVVAGLVTLYIANRHADDLVIDDYYKNGLAINRQLEKQQVAQELGFKAVLQFDDHSVTVTLKPPLSSERLTLALSHPLESDRDFLVPLLNTEPGIYKGQLRAAIAPRWYWTLEHSGTPAWRLDGSIVSADIVNAPAD